VISASAKSETCRSPWLYVVKALRHLSTSAEPPGIRWRRNAVRTSTESSLDLRNVHEVSVATAEGTVSFAGNGAFEELEAAIREAAGRLPREENWDDEGARGYAPETLERAATFLRLYARKLRDVKQASLPLPRILPGPDGSIDLHWKTGERELLVNIPPDSAAPAGFYGDDYGALCIKGTLDTARCNEGLLEWLQQR